MIKRYYEITLRDYDLIERTGQISHLKRWWNLFPVWLFAKSIEREFKEATKLINGAEREEDILIQEKWEIESRIKINQLRAALYGVINNIQNRVILYDISLFYMLNSKRKLKINPDSNFEYFAEIIERLTGFKVETIADVKKVDRHLMFKIDKLAEHIAKKSANKSEKTFLMAVAMGVCSILGIGFNPEMTILEFVEAKNIAEKKLKSQEQGNKKS